MLAYMHIYLQRNKDRIYGEGGASIDYLPCLVKIDGDTIYLSYEEYDLLLYLVRNKDVVLTRKVILNNVWGLEFDEDFSMVDIYIDRLREKLNGKGKTITNVNEIGYRFEEIG